MKIIKIQIEEVYDQNGVHGIERYTIVFSYSPIESISLFKDKLCLRFSDLPEHEGGFVFWQTSNFNKFGDKISYQDLPVDIKDRLKNILQSEIYDKDGNKIQQKG